MYAADHTLSVVRRFCDSNFVCNCLADPLFTVWYAEDCAASSINNTSSASNTTGPTGLFDSVDLLSILIAIVTGMAMLVLIALSVLYARYRKKSNVVKALAASIRNAQNEASAFKNVLRQAHADNARLKKSLEAAQ